MIFFLTYIIAINAKGLCPFTETNTLSFLPSHTKFQNSNVRIDFYWDFEQIQDEVVMGIQIDKQSYFSLGIGRKMKKSDMWIFEIINDALQGSDSYAQSHDEPLNDEKLGGIDDIVLLECTRNSQSTSVKFKRKTITNDQYDSDLIQSEAFTMIWAHGPQPSDQTVIDHQSYCGSFTFPFIQGRESIASDGDQGFYPYHKWANIICWGILVDIAILIARYWKTYRYRMEVHGALMSLIVITSFVVSALMLYQHIDIFQFSIFKERSLRVKWHFILGFIISIIILGQCIGGAYLRKCMRDANYTDESISEKPTIHEIGGHAIYLFAKINVGLGIYLSQDESKGFLAPFWIIYALIIFWRIIFEILYQKAYLIKFIVGSPKQSSIYDSENDNLLNYVELKDGSQIDQDKLWCLFNNDIIDLTNQSHPGGQYIWKKIQGREVSRYIYGSQQLEGTSFSLYTHSQYTHAMLKRQRIGSLQPIPFYFDRTSSSLSMINSNDPIHWWKLETVEPISQKISYFGFKCGSLSFRTNLAGIESFGRYFLLTSENKEINTRPYSMVLCLSKPNVEFRKQFIKLADSIINKMQTSSVPVVPEQHDELPFVIKKYESKNGFSEAIHQDNSYGNYLIQGPFGVSFGLPDSGQIVIICGGTGILPFLDLLDYFLKQTVYQALLDLHGEEVAQFANLQNIQFKNHSITLFFSVNDEEELIGKDIYFSILNLQKHLRKQNFKMILRANFKLRNIQTIQTKFDQMLFEQHLNDIPQIGKCLVCGPPRMNNEIPPILEQLGIEKYKILLV